MLVQRRARQLFHGIFGDAMTWGMSFSCVWGDSAAVPLLCFAARQ